MNRKTLAIIAIAVSISRAAFAADQNAAFEKLAKDYIDSFVASHPEQATELGDHRFDNRLTDYSKAGREKQLKAAQDARKALDAFKAGEGLSPTNKIDEKILAENLDREIFELSELKEADWNPLVYMTSLADSMYLLVARDFDTPQKRIASLRARMEAIPMAIEQAKQNLQNPPRVHTATAIDQVRATASFIRLGLDPLLNQAPEAKKELGILPEKTAIAIEQYMKWLISDLLPRSKGDFRIGPDKFRKKLRFALSSDLPMEEIQKRARADFDQTKQQMFETALPLYKKYFPADDKTTGDKNKVIAAVLKKLGEKSLDDSKIVPFCQTVAPEATAFVKSHGLVTVPDAPLEIIVMPEFKRGEAIAYCDAPGPLERNGKTFFAVAPTPNTWPQPRKETFYREYNEYMVRELTVHEAMPGHYLQLAHANQFQAPTPVRAVFKSDTFSEGWAVYGEQMMADAGYGGVEVKMQQLKMRLRVDANAIIDQGVHAQNMSNRDAMLLMMRDSFQQDGEATAKWKRAMLTSAQLSTYFVGMTEHLELRDKAKAKAGADFDLKKYNDQVLSYGTTPVKYVREMMGL